MDVDDQLNLDALDCPECGTRMQGLRTLLVCRYCHVEYDENIVKHELTPLPSLPQPALRALNNAGIHLINDLRHWTEPELLALHGVGPKAIRVLRENGAL